ncbi:MAG: Nramp family divalent metal transporter, partial [Acidobacteriota bacterium]
MKGESRPLPDQVPSPSPVPWYRILGPGVVFALTSIGPGDFVSNTAAGAVYGYSALWVLALSLVLRYVWLDTAGRYVILRQESLMSGFSRKGPWVVYAVLASLLLEGHLRNLFKYTLMGACLHLVLPLPTPYSSLIWAAFSYLFGFWMMFFRGYPTIEVVFKVLMGLMGGALVVLSALTPHDPARVFHDLLHPVLPQEGYGLER